MAYEKTNWVENETPINAENLNKIEQGIEDANNIIPSSGTEGQVLKKTSDGIEWKDETTEVVNSKTITDKSTNTYSAEIIDGLFSETKSSNVTKLYSANSFVSSGVLSESIDNFHAILIVAKYDEHNTIGSEFIPSELAKVTNIIVRAFNFNDPTNTLGARIIIENDGKTLQFIEFGGYTSAIYGVFRK